MQSYRLYLSRKNGGAKVLRGQTWTYYAEHSPPSPCSSYSVLKIDVRPLAQKQMAFKATAWLDS